MRVAFSGGEKATWRNLLLANDVDHIAINITQYHLPKTKSVNLAEVSNGATLFAYSSEGDEELTRYDDFIRTYLDDLHRIVGRPNYDGEWIGAKYVPLWNDPNDLGALGALCEQYGRVVISDKAVNKQTIPRICQLKQRWRAEMIGLTSKIDVIDAIPWDTVIVASWLSVLRYGETQVWDMHKLHRYPAQRKETARRRHRADIIRLGVDFDAVMEDDLTELAHLSIRSWRSWEAKSLGLDLTFTPILAPPIEPAETPSEQEEMGEVVIMSVERSSSEQSPTAWTPIDTPMSKKRHESERVLLPGLAMELVAPETDFDGNILSEDPVPVPLVQFGDSGVRSCDNCYLAARCPCFVEHSTCAYKLPVELKTKEQLRAVCRAILEMQTSRVLFARFAEELEGQGMDPALSSEMDRLFRLIKQLRDIEDTRDLIRFEVEAKAESGVISRLFGAKVGETARQVEPQLSQRELDSIILAADVLE